MKLVAIFGTLLVGVLASDIQDALQLDMLNYIETFKQETENFASQIHTFDYAEFEATTGMQLDIYKDQYVLRLSEWVNDAFYETASLSIKQHGYSVWDSSRANKFIDIQISQSQGVELLTLLQQMYLDEDYKSEILILNLPGKVVETFASPDELNEKELMPNSELFFSQYRTIDAIYAWFDLLLDTYPDLLTVEWIGKTYEGRDMKALRLSTHGTNDEGIKTVVITAGIHAREWIATSTSCFILYRLLQDYTAGNKAIIKYMENLDFLFLPVMNPDGYAYSWTHDRLWRKNRQQTYHPRCFGIDIDHSFNYHFTNGNMPACSEDYPGTAAFEALESYNWDTYLNTTIHTHPIYAYLDLHSYAEEILYPYAYTCDLIPRDEENLLELAYGLGQAIRLKSGKSYEVLSACMDKGADLLPSMGAGTALDYMYSRKAWWAFVLKLRDEGHGFLIPPKYILPIGKEIYASVKYFCGFLLSDN